MKKRLVILLSIFFLVVITVNAQQMHDVEHVEIVDNVTTVQEVMHIRSQPPQLNVFGTEYVFNEDGKVFLQVIDNGDIIQNATCFTTVFFPNTTSIFINNTEMIQHTLGLQFIPFVTPEVEGIYMVSASCTYFVENGFIYEENSVDIINLTVITGSVFGSPIVLNSRFDGQRIEIDSTSGGGTKTAEIDHEWNSTDLLNASSLTFQWLGAGDNAGIVINFSYFNWSNNAFQELLIKPLSGNAITLEYATAFIPQDGINISDPSQGRVRIKTLSTAAPVFAITEDWFVLKATMLTNQSFNTVRGGGELHVSQKIIDAIKNNEEELEMAGEFIGLTFLFILAMGLLIFSIKQQYLFPAVLLFLTVGGGFATLGQIPLFWLSLLLAFISLFKLFKSITVTDNDDTRQILTNKL